MRNFETMTGPSGATEEVMPIAELQVGDAWMGSKIVAIRQLCKGGQFIVTWLLHNGEKNASAMNPDTRFQKRYLELV